jgi:ABC-type cobalamin/Fe3+-siderophores transport system ATPase subunit
MYLSSIRVFNYKSFVDSGTIELKPGINIIIGQNNAGKTALLEAISFSFENIPHESLESKPTKDTKINKTSVANFEVRIKSEELKKILKSHDSLSFSIPKSFVIEELELVLNNSGKPPKELLNLVNSKLEQENSLIGTYDTAEDRIVELFLPIDEVEELPDQYWQSRLSESLKKPTLIAHNFSEGQFTQIQFNHGEGLPKRSLDHFLKEIFKFSAKRIDLETSLPVNGIKLDSDCSNLAGVITNLVSEERSTFDELVGLLSSVIFSVKDIIAKRRPHPSGIGFEYVLQVSNYDSRLRRSDLAKYLSECGTGIGQVLAILFVIVTSEQPRIILIDELQSFLHPGAVKRLLEIFNTWHIKHQYILTTHSPEVLNNSHASNVILVDIEDGISKAKSISVGSSSDMQQVFSGLGMKLSDYSFGYHFLWVEGETEKEILPLLLGNRDDINILVIRSGIIYRNRKEGIKLACELIRKFSTTENLTNRTISIVFDKETLTKKQAEELKNIGGKYLHFLPRRMTENYFLHPKSISRLLSILDTSTIKEQTVSHWIEEKIEQGWIDNNKFVENLSKNEWLKQVHGANLLDNLFGQLTDSRCSYNSHKRELGYELTKKILELEPSFLDELREFYIKCLI